MERKTGIEPATLALAREIYYTLNNSDHTHRGSVKLRASNGEILAFNDHTRYGQLSGEIMDPPLDPSEEKVSYREAAAIALFYAGEQEWPFEHEWLPNMSPVWVKGSLHTIRLNRAYMGIPFPDNSLRVWVDRKTGEVIGHELNWEKIEFNLYQDMIPKGSAAQIAYREIEPYLQWSETDINNEKRLVYTLSGTYRIEMDGEMLESENWKPPTFTEKVIPQYSKEIAKKRLLSMYDLELNFIHYSPGKAAPAYLLRIKEGVPLWYNGVHPSIDANTGEWMDHMGKLITEQFPSVSEWMIDYAAPPGQVGYKAAIVWNNELLLLNQEPIVVQGTTLVPFRDLLNKLDAKIGWDPVNRKARASKNGNTVELTVGSSTIYINGKPKPLGTPAVIKGGYTFIPARLVLETFGAQVGWNGDSRLVLVSTNSALPALTPLEMAQIRFEAYVRWEEKHS